MAILCPAGSMALEQTQEDCHAAGFNAAEAMEREDSRLPLLGITSPRPHGPLRMCAGEEHNKIAREAVTLVSERLRHMSNTRRMFNRTETSELLRETCQDLEDLTTGLEGSWRKTNPGEPFPPWPVMAIPEEEFGRIGWDFHANRVKMVRNTGGSILESIAFFLRGDEQASFAKPPTVGAVLQAFHRIAARLGKEVGVEVALEGPVMFANYAQHGGY